MNPLETVWIIRVTVKLLPREADNTDLYSPNERISLGE